MGGMAHAVIGDLAVALHTDENPSRDEWDAFMESVRKVPSSRLRVFAVTDGGGPTTVHRNQFVKYLDGAKARIAVVSDAIVVRGIVTALSWFTDGIRIFSPDDLADALAHVDLTKDQCDAVKDRLRELAPSLSVPVRAMRRV
jgi:hypothetical protein